MGGSRGNALLVGLYREARGRVADPVAAWAQLTANPQVRQAYQRGRGGEVAPLGDDEVAEIVAAAHVHTIAAYGPDRVAAHSTSMIARFVGLIGGTVLFDQPLVAAQVFGPCSEVPEPADWEQAAYAVMWGENDRAIRSPDTHWLVAGRYPGQKVVAIGSHPMRLSDETVVVRSGTDAALAMAMGHVLLKEFHLERPAFAEHAKQRTDLPFLVRLRERADGYVAHRFLTAADLGDTSPTAALKTVLLDGDGAPVVPNGSLGLRRDPARWNLTLETDPALTVYGTAGDGVELLLPRFDEGSGVLRRGVPVMRVGDHVVTTVYDLLLAQYGVARDGLPGAWPAGYDDAREPYTPGWQEPITGVSAARALKVARELAETALRTGGRCMIMPGRLGTEHADTAHRAMLALLVLTGSAGVRGGGWGGPRAESERVVETGLYFYLHADRWRYDCTDVGMLSWQLGEGLFNDRAPWPVLAEAVREGWLHMSPEYDRNPLDPDGDPGRRACDEPDDPRNWPRVLTLAHGDLADPCFEHHLVNGKLDLLVGPSQYADVPLPDVGLLAETFAKLSVDHLGRRRDMVGGRVVERNYPETAALLAAVPGPAVRPEGMPWLTLTGRMHTLVDHDWMHEYGEALPIYRPPGSGHHVKPTVMVRHRGQEG